MAELGSMWVCATPPRVSVTQVRLDERRTTHPRQTTSAYDISLKKYKYIKSLIQRQMYNKKDIKGM